MSTHDSCAQSAAEPSQDSETLDDGAEDAAEEEDEVGPDWHDRNPELRRKYSQVQSEIKLAEMRGDPVRARRLRQKLDRIGTEFWQLNKGLVIASSRRFRRAANSDKEYEGAGSLGFWEAFLRWDPERGVKFSTFSRQYISGRVLRSVRQNEFKDLTQAEFGLRDKVRKEQARLSAALERTPTAEELAAALEAPVSKVEKILGPRDISLEIPVGDGESKLSDMVSSRAEPLAIDESVVDLEMLFEDLSDLEFWVIQERSGTLGDHVQALVEVSDTIGIGREVARRAETRARVRAAAMELRSKLGREPTAAEIAARTGQDENRVLEFISSSWRDLQSRYKRIEADMLNTTGDTAGSVRVNAALDRLGLEVFTSAAKLASEIGGRFVDDEGDPIGATAAAREIWAALESWDPDTQTFPAWVRKCVAQHARRSRNAVTQPQAAPETLWRHVSGSREHSGS